MKNSFKRSCFRKQEFYGTRYPNVLDILHQIQESNSMQEERRYKIKNQNIESKIAKEQMGKRNKTKQNKEAE